MKKIIYLLFTVCLLGCQENTPKNKPVQIAQDDTIMENHDSAIVAKPNTMLNTKTDTTSKQAELANPKKAEKPPIKKELKKTVASEKEKLSNDLQILEKYYISCIRFKAKGYIIKLHKNSNTTLKFAYSEGYKEYIGRKDWENRTNFPEPTERTVGISIPFTQEEIDAQGGGKPTVQSILAPPPIPYSGKILIEYEINGQTKYQNIPAIDFKPYPDQYESRGC